MIVTTEQLANFLQGGLNANSDNIVFSISANYKEFKKSIRNKVRYEDARAVVYGILRDITNEAVPVKDLGHYTKTCELELAVTTNNNIEENLEKIYEILQNYYSAQIGKEDDIDGFKIISDIKLPTVGNEQLNNLGGSVIVSVVCNFSITKNAFTFSNVKWYIDSVEMTPILTWEMTTIKNPEVVNSADTTINKNIFKNQGMSIIFSAPHLTTTWFQNIFNDVVRDRTLNKVYTIKYVDSLHTTGITWKMGILKFPILGEPGKANGAGIVFAELRDDLVGV